MSVVTEILEKHGKYIVDGLRSSMNSKGLNSSGKTKASIESRVFQENFMTVLEIVANIALLTLSEPYPELGIKGGRGPNIRTTGELKKAITLWVDQKPISPRGISKESLIFLITRKIATEGIKVPNEYNKGGVISDVITPSLIDRIMDEVLIAQGEEFINVSEKVF